MIKFVHKKHAHLEKGRAKIIITYSAFEVLLGSLLLFTNISAMILIYNYVLKPTYKYPLTRSYVEIMPKSNLPR